MQCAWLPSGQRISIHALREEGDVHKGHPRRSLSISIHALREEGDVDSVIIIYRSVNFYPRPPRGGRHRRRRGHGRREDISIHALREEGDHLPRPVRRAAEAISIHALREEGDWLPVREAQRRPISIHALREEGDSKNRDKISIFKQIIQHSARI